MKENFRKMVNGRMCIRPKNNRQGQNEPTKSRSASRKPVVKCINPLIPVNARKNEATLAKVYLNKPEYITNIEVNKKCVP